MHRIDGPGAVNSLFTEGDPSVPQMATVVTAAWLNDVQENLAKVIEAAGITLQKGNFDQLRQAINQLSGSGEIGEIKLWPSETLPANGDWMECDGASLLVVDYSPLYAAISNTWGTATAGRFRLPDLRGLTLRGWDHGRGMDPDAALRTGGDHVGSSQDDALEKHDHPTGIARGYAAGGYEGTDDGTYVAGQEHQFTHTYRIGSTAPITADEIAAYNIPMGRETRMKNAAVMFIIRWR
jgi:microcystin-dependent protein